MSAEDLAELEQAKRNAARAKARVQTTTAALKDRLKPANLAAEAVSGVKRKTDAVGDKVSGVIKARPIAASIAAGLAALIVLRKPAKKIARLFRRRNSNPETPARPRRRDSRAGV